MKRVVLWIGGLVVISTVDVHGAPSCDCTKIVDKCSASISVKPSGTKGSYSAELKIQSSAPWCSKVDYFIDNTPYFNILAGTNSDIDSAWGQRPITKDSITGIVCSVCKRVDTEPSESESSLPSKKNQPSSDLGQMVVQRNLALADLAGTWCYKSPAGGSGTLTISGNNGYYAEGGVITKVLFVLQATRNFTFHFQVDCSRCRRSKCFDMLMKI